MFIIEKQGLEKQQLLAQITAYHAAKVLDIKTENVSLEFTPLEGDLYGNVASPDGLHLISVNENLGVTKIIETVCHELRHVWQAKHGWDFDYSLPYREQKHEIDAWDFMYQFVDEYKDIIYEEYLNSKDSITETPDDWENYLTPPPEYEITPDLSEMMGLFYTQNKNTNEKESIKMTKQFTVKQLNNAGLVASEDIKSLVAEIGIKTIKGLKTLRSELEQDNRGTVRINFKNTETFAYLLADKVIKGEVEGFETDAKVSDDALTKSLLAWQTQELKAGKYLLDEKAFVVYLSEEQMGSIIKYAVTLTNRYKKNLAAVKRYVKEQGYKGAEAEQIVRHIVARNGEKMRTSNLTNVINNPIEPLFKEVVAELFPVAEVVAESIETAVEAGVPEEEIIKTETELEIFMTEEGAEVPAADESPVAEETKQEEAEETMTKQEPKFLIKDGMISVDDHNEIVVQIQQGLIKDFQNEFTKMQDLYEETIAKLQGVIAEQNKTIADQSKEQSDDVSKLRTELDKVNAELKKVNSLRKSDAKRIEKLQDEMGRARLKLREHNVRGVSADKVYELPEQEVGSVIKARIKTSVKIGETAMAIHEEAPVKIENAAEATKNGVQWVADKTKDGIDLTAKGANVVTEKAANAMIYVAEKIAPSKEQVVESIFKVQGDVKTVELNGVVYKYGADGKLIF